MPPTHVRYAVGAVEIDVANRSVRRGGEDVFLRPKTFQVLLYLLENPDRVVSKDEILQAVWPDTAITEDTLVQSIVDIRKAVGDDSRDPWFLKTVPRRGYQLIAPVEARGALVPRDRTAPPTLALEERRSVSITVEETFHEPVRDWRHFIPHIAIGFVVLLLGGIVAASLLQQQKSVVPATPAATRRTPVAIAPFQNRTDSPDLDWLRDGIPAMVLTQLATAPDLTVIGGDLIERNVQRRRPTQGGGETELEVLLDVVRRAGAQRLITGSFQQIGDQIRVDAQIRDVSSGRVSGGGSIVANRESLLSDVDVLTSKLAGALGSRLPIADNARFSDLMTSDLEAYRLYTLGVRAANRLQNKDAIDHLEKAIARDPEFAMAHARIGYAYGVTWTNIDQARPHFAKALALGDRLSDRERLYVLSWQAIADGDFAAAIDHLSLIVSRYPMEVEAYDRMGRLLAGEQRLDEAIDVLRRALAIDRDSPQIHNALGGVYGMAGRMAEAIHHHQRYVALSPNDPNAYDSLGLSYQRAGDYQRALAAYDAASRIDPDFEVAVAHRANTYWQMGRNRDAIREFRRYIEIAPSARERQRGYTELARIYRSMGDRDRQQSALRAFSREGGTTRFFDTLAAVDSGDAATAKRLLDSHSGDDGAGRGARGVRRHELYLAAQVARVSGDRTAAIAAARAAVRLLPPSHLADDMEDVLADTLAAFGQWAEAIVEYRRVLTINANRGRTRYKLARALESAGHIAEARTEYERFLQNWRDADGDAPEVVDARRRVSALDRPGSS